MTHLTQIDIGRCSALNPGAWGVYDAQLDTVVSSGPCVVPRDWLLCLSTYEILATPLARPCRSIRSPVHTEREREREREIYAGAQSSVTFNINNSTYTLNNTAPCPHGRPQCVKRRLQLRRDGSWTAYHTSQGQQGHIDVTHQWPLTFLFI